MAVIKIEAQRRLSDAIQCAIPALRGKVCDDAAPPTHNLELPSLAIETTRSVYWPDQESEQYEPSPSSVVINVGRHVLDIKLLLNTATTYQRALIEQQLLDLFFSIEGHPGVFFSQLTDCENLGPFIASWELQEETWKNERVFDRQAGSEIKINGIIPALTTRQGVYNMDQIQLGLNVGRDVDLSTDQPDFDTVEIVTINADGTLSPL